MKKILPYIALHAIVMINTLGGVCSKTAASKKFMSTEWCILYGLLLLILFVYAVVWQQVLKKISLNIAYANKAAGVVWVMLWGCTIFGEKLSAARIIGCIMILAGMFIMLSPGRETDKEQDSNE